jgi:hypothetical protein
MLQDVFRVPFVAPAPNDDKVDHKGEQDDSDSDVPLMPNFNGTQLGTPTLVVPY